MKSLRSSIVGSLRETTTYYRGTVPGETKRISTGVPEWDDNLFVSKSCEFAREGYGSNVEVFQSKPSTKITTEKSLHVKMRKGERYLDYLVRCLRKAKELGYDIIEFERQGDVGTIIINPDSVDRAQLSMIDGTR